MTSLGEYLISVVKLRSPLMLLQRVVSLIFEDSTVGKSEPKSLGC